MPKKEVLQLEVITPKAEIRFHNLLKPSVYKEGSIPKYDVTILLDPDNQEHAKFIEMLQEFEEKAKQAILSQKSPAKRKMMNFRPIFKLDLDQDGNETGYMLFTARSQYPPVVVDSRKIKIQPPENLGRGSVVRVGAIVKPYESGINYGVTAYLQAVQIIELVEYNTAFGFIDKFGVEDGFTVEMSTEDFATGGNDSDEVPF